MKQRIAAVLLAGLMTAGFPALLPSPAVTVHAMDESMPSSIFTASPDRAYSRPCKPRFDNIPAPLLELVPEEDVNNWKNYNDILRTETAETLMEYTNVYSFIKVFELSAEQVHQVMDPAIEEETVSLTNDELNLILTASEKDILSYFMTDYPIVVGDRFYTPKWLFEHTTEEYAAAGITPEMISRKLSLYPDFPFTLEASIAFSEKLYSYVGSDAGQMNWTFTTGDMDLNEEVNVLDVVLMQRYLHKLQNIGYASWAAGDMNGDDCIDIMDLAMLKRALLKDMQPITPPEDPTEPPTEPPTENPTEKPTEPTNPTEKPTDPPEQPTEAPSENKGVMLDVIEFNQHPDYPTGCESVALYMLLKYYDVDVTVDQIIDALPKAGLPYTKNGKLYGPDPNQYFVGDPRNSSSYGVFNGPIAQVAEQFRSGVQCRTGAPLEDVIAILDTGNPVQVWYTTNPSRGIVYKREWYLDTGELFRWPGGEHSIVVCGHDDKTLTYRDPDTGGSVTMEIEFFRETYDELGGRIVYYNE
ncbi:MAG: C39 family peptidase [Oscillospiraceae bacterium]|nr:C39 family peptidase [Oscillospiraceae bacterium]